MAPIGLILLTIVPVSILSVECFFFIIIQLRRDSTTNHRSGTIYRSRMGLWCAKMDERNQVDGGSTIKYL